MKSYKTKWMTPFEGQVESYDIGMFQAEPSKKYVLEIVERPATPDSKIIAFIGLENIKELHEHLGKWLGET